MEGLTDPFGARERGEIELNGPLVGDVGHMGLIPQPQPSCLDWELSHPQLKGEPSEPFKLRIEFESLMEHEIRPNGGPQSFLQEPVHPLG